MYLYYFFEYINDNKFKKTYFYLIDNNYNIYGTLVANQIFDYINITDIWLKKCLRNKYINKYKYSYNFINNCISLIWNIYNIKKICLQCYKNNIKANKLYKNLKFKNFKGITSTHYNYLVKNNLF